MHATYAHLWDEVNCKFRRIRQRLYLQRQGHDHQPIIVQRGALSLIFGGDQIGPLQHFEPWLCQPRQVAGVDAASLMPAVRAAVPSLFDFFDLEAIDKLSRSFTSATLAMLGDKMSSNLVLLRRWGQEWQDSVAPRCRNVFFWAESCGVHLHHRAKLLVRPLQTHTMRHFSIANIYRHAHKQTHMINNLENIVTTSVKRRIGPPPKPEDCQASLSLLVDILFDKGAQHHVRKGGKRSQHMEDLDELCQMVNGCLLDRDGWVHFCWCPDKKRPCCTSQSEAASKTLVRVVNSLMRIPPVPAESRWANTLSNFKQTLLRRLVYRCGLACFAPQDTEHVADEVSCDAEATDICYEGREDPRQEDLGVLRQGIEHA